MSRSSVNRIARQGLIEKYISGNPFLTDEDLAETLGVSIQTIRLDRSEMSIPEMRLRVKNVASGVYGQVRSIGVDEMIGELVDLDSIEIDWIEVPALSDDVEIHFARSSDGVISVQVD